VVKTNKAIYRHKRTGDLFAIETDETNTDNESVDGAYKKCAKNFYSDGLQTSLIGTGDNSESPDNGDNNASHKSFDMTTLGTEIEQLSPGDISSNRNTHGSAQNAEHRIQ
jgi:hypothetical protein